MKRLTVRWIPVVAMLMMVAAPILCKIFTTKDVALKRTFPEATAIQRQDVFLSDEDVTRIEALARTKLEGKLYTFHRAENQGRVLGYAFIGTRIIRTKPAVYMVVIEPGGKVGHVEILAFHEPEEYLPTKRWFNQFAGKFLNDNLWPGKEIHAVTGATMSVDAISQEVRRALAIFRCMVLKPDSPTKDAGE